MFSAAPLLVEPLVGFDAISREQLNRALLAWGHQMGPLNRPTRGWAHGLRHHGELVAVTATETLIRERVAGLNRSEAVELARVCAIRRDLCRPVLRIWREFVFPALSARHGWRWAISYQDAAVHTGDLYRFDGWVVLGKSRSGTDARSGRRGRRKIIWGWCSDPVERRACDLRRLEGESKGGAGCAGPGGWASAVGAGEGP